MRATRMATRTLFHINVKRRKSFSNINICLGGINKLFESKNRITNLTLNSRRVFENRQYFFVQKSYFETIFLMRYNSESLEINVLLNRNDVLFEDIKISLGLLIIATKQPVLFSENHNTDLSSTANNRITRYAFFSSTPKFQQNLIAQHYA